jgi:Bcr/CflA subfamily drug resistance transporter
MHSNKTQQQYFLFPLLLALYEAAVYLSTDAYLPALPDIARTLKTTHHLVQLTLTSWFMGASAIQLFIGPLSDRIGRRPVLLAGAVLFILVTLGCAWTDNIHTLLWLRFLQGTTVASMVVPGYATIHDMFSQKKAIQMVAMIGSITILAPSFGPLLGAMILYVLDWRWIFGLLAIWACMVVVGLYFKMPETQPASNKKIKFKAVLRHYKTILTNRSFVLFMLITQCLFMDLIVWIAAGPFLLIDHFHFHTLGFGVTQIFIFGSFIAGMRSVTPLMQKVSLKIIGKSGILIAFLGSVYALGTSIFWPDNVWHMIVSMMFLAGGSGLSFPIFNRLAIESSDEPMDLRVAVSSFFMSLSGAIGSGIVSQTHDYRLVSLAVLLFISSILAILCMVMNRNALEHIEATEPS